MRYLLDSDLVSDFYDKTAPGHVKISARLAALADSDEVFISIISLYEFEYGLANAPDEKKALVEKKIAEAGRDFSILPLSATGARHFGVLKKTLKERRSLTKEAVKKHNVDMVIAATAVTERCTLVSADTVYDDLRRSHPELKLENWLASMPEAEERESSPGRPPGSPPGATTDRY